MKKIIAGTGFELTRTLMVLCTSLMASMNMENTTEWNTELGRYWQTVSDMSLFPVLITGIAFSLWGVFSKEDK